MTFPRMRFTVRDVLIANLAVGILLAWIVGWEQHRVQSQRALAGFIVDRAAHDPYLYGSPQAAMEQSNRVAETARLWAEGWPSGDIIASGLVVDLWVVGLSLAISKAVSLKVRQARRTPGCRLKS